VILVVPRLPASILRELELVEVAKSGGPASVTATRIVVVCETELLVPVMVTV
jgi:hypothetical protein